MQTTTHPAAAPMRPAAETRTWRLWLWISGLGSLLLGAGAIAFPVAATLAAELVFGGLLAALGVIVILRAAASQGWGQRLWIFLHGLAAVVAGVILLLFPLTGALTLTIVVAGFFVVAGVFKLFSSLYLRRRPMEEAGLPAVGGAPGWVAVSGALSLGLGLLLFIGLPGTGIWAIGMLVGIDFLVFGACEIGLALGLRSKS